MKNKIQLKEVRPDKQANHRLEKEVRPQELSWSSKECFLQGKKMAVM